MYKRANRARLKHFDFLIVDMLSLEVAFLLAYIIRHGFHSYTMMGESYTRMIFVLLLIEYVSASFLRTFFGVLWRGYYKESIVTLRQAACVTLLSVFYIFSIRDSHDYSRITLYLTGILYFFISYFTRCVWKQILKSKPSLMLHSIIFVTTQAGTREMVRHFQKHNFSNAGIVGLILTDASRVGERIEGCEVVADLESAEKYVQGNWVDEILFGLDVEQDTMERLEDAFLEMGITVHRSLLKNWDINQTEKRIEEIGGYTVLTRSIRILTAGELFMKRMMDIAGAVVGCLLCGILFIFVAPAIYIASPGPVFFSQERIGKNGKVFRMHKFRSMYLDAEERLKELKDKNEQNDHFMFKMENDPRIIGSEKGPGKGIGHFIRRTSIDEFPQFWNVLVGEMSLCGTRPPLKSEWELYEKHHRARMATKPGITGMWQVSGRSNIKDFEDVVRLDMEYIENWSFGLDLKIIGKTVVQVLKGEGSV